MKNLLSQFAHFFAPNKPSRKILKVIDAGVTAGGLSTGAPSVYAMTKFGLDQLTKYVMRRNDERSADFHRRLLYLNNEVREIEVFEIDEANYHALLNSCIADIETEKTKAYATLTFNIAAQKVKQELRRHFILALKDISYDQLDYLRRLFVLNKYSVESPEGPVIWPSSLLKDLPIGSTEHLTKLTLAARGFVEGDNITGLGEYFVTSCSIGVELAPEVFEYNKWSDWKSGLFVAGDFDYKDSTLPDSVLRKLESKGIKKTEPGQHVDNLYVHNHEVTCGIVLARKGCPVTTDQLKRIEARCPNCTLIQVLYEDGSVEPDSQDLLLPTIISSSEYSEESCEEILQLLVRTLKKAKEKP